MDTTTTYHWLTLYYLPEKSDVIYAHESELIRIENDSKQVTSLKIEVIILQKQKANTIQLRKLNVPKKKLFEAKIQIISKVDQPFECLNRVFQNLERVCH
ncbi:hypothetical protein FGO68_gene12599 [Halteria grandinella]|uniref:Uncharacterized protein n=1 Tax=Halteria grandinella TaxID=5974 RepID=A0A8J8NFU8_HALGN|nr:hypothetical protein FGO68_gene12599 [Halteria grandinella]